MDVEPFTLRRNNSLKSFVYRSLRIPRKKKPPEKLDEVKEEEEKVFIIEQVESRNLVIHRRRSTREDFRSVFDKVENVVGPCNLIQFFLSEGKPYDKECPLMSFERKMRSHFHFGAGHYAKEQLFCPEQASQIELHFQSATNEEVVLRVTAPNGESSSLIRPTRKDYVCFNPSKVGCGHGTWVVDVAVRQGCRFKHVHRRQLLLNGQGVLMYHVDPDYKLRQVDRLWLGFR